MIAFERQPGSFLLDPVEIAPINSLKDLYQWEEFSRDSLNVKRVYVDVAGDLIAGILLSQIVYWNLPSKNGSTKLRVKKEGYLWLAKGRNDWWDEVRISPKQFDRAIKILKDTGVVETKLFKFDGVPTVHIRLIGETLMQRVKSIFTFGENPNSPLGEMEIDQMGKSLTEITTETTTKKINYAVYVSMKESEYKKLVDEYGEERTHQMIELLDNYKGANPKKRKYESDYRAILSWVKDEVLKKNPLPKQIKEVPEMEPPDFLNTEWY